MTRATYPHCIAVEASGGDIFAKMKPAAASSWSKYPGVRPARAEGQRPFLPFRYAVRFPTCA